MSRSWVEVENLGRAEPWLTLHWPLNSGPRTTMEVDTLNTRRWKLEVDTVNTRQWKLEVDVDEDNVLSRTG